MPPIEIGPTRPAGAVQTKCVATCGAAPAPVAAHRASAASAPSAEANATGPAAQVQRSAALDAGSPPVDTDRVAVIRHAIQTGTYPIIPARVADAMIAAGMLLGKAA